ncbi:hypothetical protein CIHG_00812 [Coccidioides immitis H538.4]|uniref:Uncharacterized protein n=3 Tax=Coccidioides immitis TaxID=5501 RepID=A0A0J8QL51_COCIT|nr:hypothetical protein CIRG_03228 [Coccidioides immitis RMSCC 2394]KMU73124.1 hypothetical protein CISG_03385 [Coccidioides immitis RMSCC 3703]KMU83030.1 hypothetical protein CIHG_00812 [Coccidioides immitis H538.4]
MPRGEDADLAPQKRGRALNNLAATDLWIIPGKMLLQTYSTKPGFKIPSPQQAAPGPCSYCFVGEKFHCLVGRICKFFNGLHKLLGSKMSTHLSVGHVVIVQYSDSWKPMSLIVVRPRWRRELSKVRSWR